MWTPTRLYRPVTSRLTQKDGFGPYLFHDWRFNADGSEKKDFVLNNPDFKDAVILVAGKNFGSGSSREHAAWAIAGYGFRVVIRLVLCGYSQEQRGSTTSCFPWLSARTS